MKGFFLTVLLLYPWFSIGQSYTFTNRDVSIRLALRYKDSVLIIEAVLQNRLNKEILISPPANLHIYSAYPSLVTEMGANCCVFPFLKIPVTSLIKLKGQESISYSATTILPGSHRNIILHFDYLNPDKAGINKRKRKELSSLFQSPNSFDEIIYGRYCDWFNWSMPFEAN